MSRFGWGLVVFSYACLALAGADRRFEYARTSLSFEPNLGQSDSRARFTAKSPGYSVELDATSARFEFRGRDTTDSLEMKLENAKSAPQVAGEQVLPGKVNYFPTGDPKTWITNVPTYSRVHYSDVYQGVDVSFHGTNNRLEYDFLVQAGVDPGQIRMKFRGSPNAVVDGSGDLVFSRPQGKLRFLKPVAYQLAADGRTHVPVDVQYQLDRHANVTFALGQYDRKRELIIDPVVDALSYSEYLGPYYAAAVAVDSAGNSYVTGASTGSFGFYVTQVTPSGVNGYTSNFGTGIVEPQGIAVDASGAVYVTGYLNSTNAGGTVPVTSSAYQSSIGTAAYSAFFLKAAAGGGGVSYCTFLSGSDAQITEANSVAVDATGKAYIAGYTSSGAFPVTAGAYQTSNTAGTDTGFVAKFDSTQSGTASLVYATLLGSASGTGSSILNGIAVDASGDAYVAASGPATYPVTEGAFRYNGYESASGGAYVTKLNSSGSGLVYSAYLGYGAAYGIAVEGAANSPSAYVTGTVGYADFPVTAGAYQTSYASGFAVKMSGDGSSEIYSTFLSGPSGYNGTAIAARNSIALPYGCQSSCNAYLAGLTTSLDFPAINAIQSTTAIGSGSAYIVELNSSGTSALFSSCLSGLSDYVEAGNGASYGSTPAIAVDSYGNMSVAGNTNNQAGSSDFPQTSVDAITTGYSFLARITPSASAGFLVPQPASVNFGSVVVGVSTSLYSGGMSVRLSNYSSTTVTSLSIITAPAIFSESDNCDGQIPPGSYCSLTLNYTPNSAVARTGTVTITSSASNSPTVISLSGTGVDAAFTWPSRGSLVFGNQAVGTSSAAQTFTFTNYGDETTALPIAFDNGTDFSQLNNCPSQLAPGASCTFSVTFSPTLAGARFDALSVNNYYVQLSGSGTVSGGTSGLTFSQSALQFDPQATSTTSAGQNIYITNSGSSPVSIQSLAASGNFTVNSYNCGGLPFQLNPQASCYAEVFFAPTTAGTLTGALTFTDSASGSPQSVPLSGVGVQSTQTVEFYPSSSVAFPNTPVGSLSGYQIIYLNNTGTATLTVDRATVSGDFMIANAGCEAVTIAGTSNDGTGTASYCAAYVEFAPTAIGTRTGTLTFMDSATGSPHVVTLTGNGMAQTGTIALNPGGLNFSSQTVGSTSAGQIVYTYNTGDSAVVVNSVTSSLPDYTVSGGCSVPYNLPGGNSCYVYIYFTPTTTGTRAGLITFATTAGNQTLSVTGVGVAAAQSIGFTPASSMNLGTVVSGQSGSAEFVYYRNTGTEAITFSAAPTITGTNASEFALSNSCGIAGGSTLAVNATCYIQVRFSASTTGAASATLTFTDSAGTQTIALSGTGVSAKPTYTLTDYLISYNTQLQGTSSGLSNYIDFQNNGSSAVTVGNMAISGAFVIPHGYDTCSASTVAVGGNCYVYVEFAPASAGYQSGTLTFTNSSGTALSGAPVVPLAGFAAAATYSAYVNPTTETFPSQQVVGTLSSTQTIVLYNAGNTPLTLGTLSGTDLGLAGASAEFSIYGANSGSDHCSGTTVAAGGSCSVSVTFTPNGTGTRTGTILFPVTYGNGTTATLTENLSGTGVAEINSAVVNPVAGSFIDQTVGAATIISLPGYLYNGGNQPFTVGNLVNSNSTEFSLAADNCSGVTVAVGSQCMISIKFTPSATGARSGSITFPVTFADHTTANPQMTLAGTGVTAAKTIAISPAALQFPQEIETVTSSAQTVTVTNTGNQSVTVGTDTVSTTQFNISSDGCTGISLAPKATCAINITFTPGSSSTGTQTASLTIGDNATGGPHSVALSGIAIPASQQIVVSQTALAFGNEPAGSSSSAQLVYFTNQSDSSVTVSSYVLGGTNRGDFTGTNNCGSTFAARSTCSISFTFTPLAGTSGALSATLTETDSGSPGTHVITLTGTAGSTGPAAALNPSTLTFSTQNVHTTSATQNFSVTNTGTGSLAVTSVASTNSTEFAVVSDGCTGTTLTNGQHCLIGVQFSPSLGGTRTGSITVADNAAGGSPQTLAVTGTGYGIPTISFAPASLTFASQNVNTTSAAQTVTVSNPGTDALLLGSISVTGANAAEFAQSNNCPASLAPLASCVINVSFKPAAGGTQIAYVSVTDNANNAAGSTQSVPLSGTGLSTPTAAVSPSSLSFPSTLPGSSSSPLGVTVSNTGAGPLTISNILIAGSNSGDFGESSSCGGTLAAGSNCSVSVTFTPTAAGSRTATLYIVDNSSTGSSQTVTLSGSGTAGGAPAAALSPSSLTFQTQTDGTSSAVQTLTLANSGNAPLNIASIEVGGTDPGDFAETNNCGSSLAAAANCTISVTFKPMAAGSRMATVVVTDNSAGSTQTATLTGTGTTSTTPAVGSLSPASGTGLTQTFTAVYSDPDGLGNLGTAKLLFNTAISGVNACDIYYTVSTNSFYLYNNADNGQAGPLTPGSSSSISNSQCTLAGTGTSVTTSGNTLTIKFAITFQSAFSGLKNVYMEAISSSGSVSSGWTQEGTWTPATATPAVVSLSPASGTGLTQTFTAVYSDPNGLSNLGTAKLLFNTAISGVNACDIYYTVSTNSFYLYNDAGQAVYGPLTPGSSSSISNSQCTLAGTGTSVTTSGNTLTINFAITFGSTFTGSKNVYMEAINSSGSMSSGWTEEGTWTP